jgi:GntR family transcriptional regulator
MENFGGLANGAMPLHEQLKEAIRRDIATGKYIPEEKLPSEAEFTQLYGISRTTVRNALNDLVNEGILSRKQGVGTFIAAKNGNADMVRLTDFVEDMVQAGLTATSKMLKFEPESATAEVAESLAVQTGTKTMRLERLRLGNNQPIAFDITWLPLRYGLLLADEDLGNNTIYSLLESKFDIPVLRGTYFIEACNADDYLAQPLEIAPGTALLLLTRISYTDGNKPVYYQKRYIRSENIKYRISLERHATADQNRHASLIREFVPVFPPV